MLAGPIALNELLQREGREKRKEGIKEGREAGTHSAVLQLNE